MKQFGDVRSILIIYGPKIPGGFKYLKEIPRSPCDRWSKACWVIPSKMAVKELITCLDLAKQP